MLVKEGNGMFPGVMLGYEGSIGMLTDETGIGYAQVLIIGAGRFDTDMGTMPGM